MRIKISTAEASTHIQKNHLTHLLRTYYTNYTKAHFQNSRKEVFQPHLPVRLPCYDLAPVTCITLGRPLRLRTLGTPDSHGLTGGVYKARERIHRAMADARLLANPASRSRVDIFQFFTATEGIPSSPVPRVDGSPCHDQVPNSG